VEDLAPLALEAAGILAVAPGLVGGVRIRDGAGPLVRAWTDHVAELLSGQGTLRRLPGRMDADRLLGHVDVAESLRAGGRRYRPGILEEVGRGVLLLPMADRADPEVLAILSQVLDTGLAVTPGSGAGGTAVDLAVVALDDARADEAGTPELLAERLALHLALDTARADDPGGTPHHPRGTPPGPGEGTPYTHGDVEAARTLAPRVSLDPEQVEALAFLGLRIGAPSLRTAAQAAAVARIRAALQGRTGVQDEDLAIAVSLVLMPRATVLPEPVQDESSPPPDGPPPPPPEPGEDTGGDEQNAGEVQELAERVLEATRVHLPDGLELAEAMARSGARSGRRGALIRQLREGHRVGARPGDPRREGRLDLSATLRAAAPWQRLRRRDAPERNAKVLVEKSDLHVQLRARRSATATIFLVDASGSQALNRLAEAKGAVELLLGDSYVRREEVALIAFRGTGAETLLPPTRSLVRARRALAGLPGGGGTPLAAGIMEGLRMALRLRDGGMTPRMVCLSDGRPNVTREGKGGRPQAREESLAAARLVAREGVPFLILDTSPRGEPFAGELARAGAGQHLHLPRADARVVRAALDTLPG
jgi:magnesium chelatase subunit D